MQKCFYLETFGCQMNVVDSERIVSMLVEIGYQRVNSAEAADLVLLNTCSVRDKAERKVYGHLGRFKPIKDARPELIIGVGGCVAEQEGEKMLAEVPYLDLVFGTHNVHRLPELVQQAEAGHRRLSVTGFLDRETRLNLFPQRSELDGVTRFVTVMQGCDNFCSYCIVPHVRGREISRPSKDILAEVELLVAQGVREVTLLGQNVNSYGNKEPGELNFAQLVRKVAAIRGLSRLRFTTSHPKDLSDELIACFAELENLCHHLHLPVQCGSNEILKQMNRGYTREEYLETVKKLKLACPDIRLTTDVIVGFPGETEEDFQQTLDLVTEVGYADAFTFLYSRRSGTAAAELEDKVGARVKQQQFDRLLALQQENSRRIWASDLGRSVSVLVEGESRQGEGQMFGRSTWNRIVNFAGSPELLGQTVTVKITKVFRNSSLGELLPG
ncbi:tRNA (N6-isopentenyl adenosine(37)-C2)-methylthiotransferase MiaB [Geopsychrobacter electrodiphilus]|uniref:tRNA (N6-isopentenyl adenosine(37)-C2)-methylthiotransferase MiaB n=1 Tax=Geopsychrobacter electrodiphilus TaxID=225196 RepID=UPI00036367E5|nr:tRNA (N6-isopentenyl adenosine(37)-C2)-methylthiotransferase MiaB [Geopsychrobacter electrodiphilus]